MNILIERDCDKKKNHSYPSVSIARWLEWKMPKILSSKRIVLHQNPMGEENKFLLQPFQSP